ncbi:MAG TPA: type II secretion system F family protein [Rickettsiales bacterium]|nr:type II secretion system F family protein [Rickettsiales bacterium]
MDNILLPAAAAGSVFVICLVAALKLLSSDESQRKQALLGRIMQDSRDSASTVGQEVSYDQLLKYSPGDAASFPYNLPGVRQTRDLLVRSGMWEQRALVIFFTIALFFGTIFALHNLGAIAILIGLILAYLVPRKYLNSRINKRNQKFLDMFPDAVDLIVRSVRSGHPINTAMRMITENMDSPIRDEFKQVTDEVSYGRTLPEALKRMSSRLGLQDVDFFVVVLSVQQETGGSLTEVLTNLSSIIRKRKQLRAKIRAMTSEGRATSYILGGIPVVEFCALYYITPSYLDPLFTTLTGNIILGAACTLIVISQIVIRAMIDIDI